MEIKRKKEGTKPCEICGEYRKYFEKGICIVCSRGNNIVKEVKEPIDPYSKQSRIVKSRTGSIKENGICVIKK